MKFSFSVILYPLLVLAAPKSVHPGAAIKRPRGFTHGNSSIYTYHTTPHEKKGLMSRDWEDCLDTPAGVDQQSLCGDRFLNMKDHRWTAAIASMPVFLFSRIDAKQVTCYPESAIQIGSNPAKPNPGTDPPNGVDPSQNCVNPGPYHGDMTMGNPFPVYVDGDYCSGDDSWRISYDLYFVHDGIGAAGHKHDWQQAVVIWKGDGTDDWWKRDSTVLARHDQTIRYAWNDLITVDAEGTDDQGSMSKGGSKGHPKVFVSLYKHAMFPDKDDDDDRGPGSANTDVEYRSTDWWRLPELSDVHWGIGEISASWDYGEATSKPSNVIDGICRY